MPEPGEAGVAGEVLASRSEEAEIRESTDMLVVGGGIVGLRIALSWRARHGDQRVVLLEKEPQLGAHASGRNSGVLHAGFYYTADSLKARFSRDGCRALTEYCQQRGLPLERCGKLVVARNEAEHAGLDELLRRAAANGVTLEPVSEAEAREIEPAVRTAGRALWSPTTATVDPGRVLESLRQDARDAGVEVRTGTPYLGRRGRAVQVPDGELEAGYLVNAAGLQADRVAADFGFGAGYALLPFKGLYLYGNWEPGRLRTNVYPVPDLRNPFLGVHFTRTVEGHAKIGPTATPALWRENYGGLAGFQAGELVSALATQARLLVGAGFDFRGLALQELRKLHRPTLVSQAAELLEGVRQQDWRTWGRPGIRAQLLDLSTRKLVMDFLLEGDDRSLHVLNAISPGFTCSFPFAEHVCDEVERLRG